MIEDIDKNKIENCRNILYKLIQASLRQEPIHEVVGRDLTQKVFNMDFHDLTPKEQNQFDELVLKVVMGQTTMLLVGEDLISEHERSVFEQSQVLLRKELERDLSKPNIKADDDISVIEETSKFYTRTMRVLKLRYDGTNKQWIVICDNDLNPSKNVYARRVEFPASNVKRVNMT